MENRLFLNRYRLSLAHNGMPVELNRTPTAVIYRAQEIQTGREVGLELVTAAIASAGLRQALEIDAIAARKINHANIPKLYDFGFDSDEMVYVTECCEGHTAAAWVAVRGSLPVSAVLRVALQVVDTLSATAFHHIVHHSLNPDTILFLGNQTKERDWPLIKVLHWLGVAPIFGEAGDPRLDQAACFASPEQLYANLVEVPSEIYSLGATMWFLLTGAAPAPAAAPGIAAAAPLPAKLTGAPKIVGHLLGKMMHPDPDKRPQDPVALAAYLQTCLGRVERWEKSRRRSSAQVVVKPRIAAKRVWPQLPAKHWAVAAALLALALVAALALPRRFQASNSLPARPRSEMAGARSRNEMAGMANKPSAPKSQVAKALTVDPIVEIPREKPISVANEPAPPAEGPADQTADTPAFDVASNEREPAKQPDTSVAEEANENRPIMAENAPPKIRVETLPRPAADVPAPVQSEPTPPSEAASASRVATKSKARTKKSHARKERSVARVKAKRAEPLPELQFGSARAELVGTTADGRWILSVGDSGKRVIVPPPPGFANQ